MLKFINSYINFKSYSVFAKMVKNRSTNIVSTTLDPKVKKIRKKLLYNDYLLNNTLNYRYKKTRTILKSIRYKILKKKFNEEKIMSATSILANTHDNDHENSKLQNTNSIIINDDCAAIKTGKNYLRTHTSMFHNHKHDVECNKTKVSVSSSAKINSEQSISKTLLHKNYLDVINMKFESDKQKKISWMSDYEIYNDAVQNSSNLMYGTPDPDASITSVKCGGCGALLHCKDIQMPGYLPSELIIGKNNQELQGVKCQRCHFITNYDTCIDLKMSTSESNDVMSQLKSNGNSTAIILIDLTNFPCEVWPYLSFILGNQTTVFIVGNKIDLLPPDSSKFIENVKDCLTESIVKAGILKNNIKHVGLISAKTGYGIEQLINKIHKFWNRKGDIYLVGCANTGKSTLFNMLLQSDLCQSQAANSIQHATTSLWPGTTLNLLKFPILKPNQARLHKRLQRLKTETKISQKENYNNIQEFKETKNIELLALQGRVNHTFKRENELHTAISKSNKNSSYVRESVHLKLDENSHDYKNIKWFYDTPGIIQSDLISNFLTSDELALTLPSKIISPRTFCLWPGHTVFIAGLGRLDILSAPTFVRCTIFSNIKLPITVCKMKNADYVYEELLNSEAFCVPVNNPSRLENWPKLKFKEIGVIGIGEKESAADVVLSNAGWIAITAKENENIMMRSWTPGGLGIYTRIPALLPYSVNLRGSRLVGTPAYRLGRQVYISRRK
ncbi:hypothetical protein TKK_0015743 [Trichogramma kaykai]